MTQKLIENKLSVIFEFTQSGGLKNILLNSLNDRNQTTLERALERLMQPNQFSWVRGLFRRW